MGQLDALHRPATPQPSRSRRAAPAQCASASPPRAASLAALFPRHQPRSTRALLSFKLSSDTATCDPRCRPSTHRACPPRLAASPTSHPPTSKPLLHPHSVRAVRRLRLQMLCTAATPSRASRRSPRPFPSHPFLNANSPRLSPPIAHQEQHSAPHALSMSSQPSLERLQQSRPSGRQAQRRRPPPPSAGRASRRPAKQLTSARLGARATGSHAIVHLRCARTSLGRAPS